jgi:4-oxalmesaconate hydratase
VPELRRCVEEMGFVGCNLNPDPSGGYWTGKPMTDREWYPLYEALCDLDVPAMVHVAASCNPFHGTGAHYLNADTSVFMQLLQSDLFKDFPDPAPGHPAWRRRCALSLGTLSRHVAGDGQASAGRSAGQHLLRYLRLSPPGRGTADQGRPTSNVLFGSEMIGAVRGKDPDTDQYFDDTKRYLRCLHEALSDADRLTPSSKATVRRVYPRLDKHLKAKGK